MDRCPCFYYDEVFLHRLFQFSWQIDTYRSISVFPGKTHPKLVKHPVKKGIGVEGKLLLICGLQRYSYIILSNHQGIFRWKRIFFAMLEQLEFRNFCGLKKIRTCDFSAQSISNNDSGRTRSLITIASCQFFPPIGKKIRWNLFHNLLHPRLT